jgi:hypothetical protein
VVVDAGFTRFQRVVLSRSASPTRSGRRTHRQPVGLNPEWPLYTADSAPRHDGAGQVLNILRTGPDDAAYAIFDRLLGVLPAPRRAFESGLLRREHCTAVRGSVRQR